SHYHHLSLHSDLPLRDLHSFPTRRSSDLLDLRLLAELYPRHEPAVEVNYQVKLGDVHDLDDLLQFVDGLAALLELAHNDAIERRSEEHTSELQSRFDLVCRLLLEKKK